MSISIRGLEEVTEALEERLSEENNQKVLERACQLVERRARQIAPKGDGHLRRSISHRIEGEEGIVYTNLLYAPYVEYGTGLFAEDGGRTAVPWRYEDEKGEWHTTSGMDPMPFMRPALDQNRDKIIQLFREGITKK